MRALKIISDLLPIPSYTVIIICFFLPFITIKCGTTELVSVTGFDYVIGNDMKDKMESSEFAKTMKEKMGKDMFKSEAGENDSIGSDKDKKSDKIPGMPEDTPEEKQAKILFFVIMAIPFILAIAGLVISFLKVKRKSLIHIILSSIGFLSLLGYGIIIKASSDANALSTMGDGLGAGMISINLGTSYYVATLFFLVIVMFFGMEKYLKKLYREEQEIREENIEDFYSKEEL